MSDNKKDKTDEEYYDVYGGKTRAEVNKDVLVNRFRLDEENEAHPTNYLFYADLLAEAKKEKDRAEEELDAHMNTMELKIRKEPPDELTKVTDSAVKSLIVSDEKTIELRQAVNDCKYVIYKLDAVVRSLEQKKNNLDNLTVLWSKGYYSLPDGGKNFRNGNDAAQTEARKNLNKEGE
jgi:hypothetical protein